MVTTPDDFQPNAARPLFAPILAGATLRDRLIGCVGALAGIGLAGFLSHLLIGDLPMLPFIVAPLGASAVLLFAVPASPLAQPWPIVGGNTISAAIGVAVALLVPDVILAAPIGVAIAILVMSLCRCLHPPGGAAALTAVLAGPNLAASDYLFPLLPVALNSALLVLLGIVFHRLTRRAYPHAAAPAPANTHRTADLPPQLRVGFLPGDIDAALARLDETFDIDRADLDRLFREVEHQALLRAHGNLTCAEIMSRDVVTIGTAEDAATARRQLLDHNIRVLPVLDPSGRLAGSIGLREIAGREGPVGALAAPALTARGPELAMNLVPRLSDGRSHAVIIVDEDNRVAGLITQTDLLAALARSLAARLDYSI